jgi:hypothetical protein
MFKRPTLQESSSRPKLKMEIEFQINHYFSIYNYFVKTSGPFFVEPNHVLFPNRCTLLKGQIENLKDS